MEKLKTMEQAESSKEKTELIGEMKSLEDFPIEVLVKIFNFLPNHAIRCGVSLTCKRFQKICQDESLVPVKDLCIKGQNYRYWSGGKQICGLRNIGNVIDIIVQSKDLTTLKIKALNYESIYHLVSTALQVCPKLIHLEIVETFAQSIERDEDGGMAEDGCEYLFLILKLTIELIIIRRNNSILFFIKFQILNRYLNPFQHLEMVSVSLTLSCMANIGIFEVPVLIAFLMITLLKDAQN